MGARGAYQRRSGQTTSRARRGRDRQAGDGAHVKIEIDVEIEVTGLGRRGDGLATAPDGDRLYIAKSLPGDRLRVRLGPSRGDARAAEIVDILRPGPGRVAPPCPHFARCGGCALQHLEDAAYIGWKLDHLRRALERAGFDPGAVAAPVRIPPRARRRATLSAVRPADMGAPVRLGFTAARSHDVVDLAVCPVLDPAIEALLPSLRGLAAETLAPGERMRITLARLDGGLDVVIDWPEPPPLALRERWATFAAAEGLIRLSWRRGPAGATGPAGLAEPVIQTRPARIVYAGTTVAVPPGAFLQASRLAEAALTEIARVSTAGCECVADLFCGLGAFALALAAAGRRVHAVDADGPAIASLAEAGRGLAHVSIERRNLFARPLSTDELARFDAVVFDPPRDGARAQAHALAASAVPTVVAISCNPDTFIRDARILAAGGYRLDSVTPVDQFLWSPHLELAAVFRR